MRVTAEKLKRWKFACMRVTLCRQRLRASRDRRSSTVAHAQAAGRHCRSIQRDGSLICNKDTLRSALFGEGPPVTQVVHASECFVVFFFVCVCGRQTLSEWLALARSHHVSLAKLAGRFASPGCSERTSHPKRAGGDSLDVGATGASGRQLVRSELELKFPLSLAA